MTLDDEILKELKWQTKLKEAEIAMLNDIKFELINSRVHAATYTIPIPTRWQRFRYWLKGMINRA